MLAKLRCLCLLLLACTPVAAQEGQPVRRLPVRVFQDKMKGAWLGQMIGVGWGAPTEKGAVSGNFGTQGCIMPEGKVPQWKPEMVNQHHNDDLFVEMSFLRTLEVRGFDASSAQAGVDFACGDYRCAHANRAGLDNLRKGIAPPDSGHPWLNGHADDLDYQIESDYSGIIAPGLPNVPIALGEKFGRLMNYGDGVYGGQFVGGMYAEAYFESDPRKIVEAGLKCLPPESDYAGMVRDLLEWSRTNPDWTQTWQLVEDKYHKNPRYQHGLCSKPGSEAFGIDAKLNGAYIVMGLLYGTNDLAQTITIAMRCGQDSDCNPANAAGVLGAVLGASNIPSHFTGKLDLARKFRFSDYTVPQVYDLSERLARQAVTRAGGTIEKDAGGEEVFVIPVQAPKPGEAEKSCEPGPVVNSKFTDEEMGKILNSQLAKVDKQLLIHSKVDLRRWLDAGLTNRIGPFVAVRAGPAEKFGKYLFRSTNDTFKVNLQWSMAAGAAFPYFDGTLVLGDPKYRQAALEVADAFLRLQEPEGFWRSNYRITPGNTITGEWSKVVGGNYMDPTGRECRVQDYFQSGPFYLMLAAYKQTADKKYLASALRLADYLLSIQNDNGSWPDCWVHGHTRTGNTTTSISGVLEGGSYNDGATSASMRILLCAHRLTNDKKYLAKFPQLGQWLFDTQLGRGKVRGWCQQYGADNKPAEARSFELPLIEGRVFNRFILQMAGWFYMTSGEERYIRLIKKTRDWMKSVEKSGPEGGWAYQYTPDGEAVFSVDYKTYRYDQPETWPKDLGKRKELPRFSRVKAHLGNSEEVLALWEAGGLERTRAEFRATTRTPWEARLAAACRLLDEKNLAVARQRLLQKYLAGEDSSATPFKVNLEGMAQLDCLLDYGIATGAIQSDLVAPRNEPMWASSHGYGDMRGTPLKPGGWVPVTPINQESPFELGWFSRAFDADLWSGIELPAGPNMQYCPEGKWEIGGDKWGPIIRVNMLKIEDADWEKVPGVKKAWRMKGFEGVAGMAFHPVISEVKDVDADGKPDIFRRRSEEAGAKIERLRYDDGSVVWESGPVGELYGDEGRLAVYELNGPKDWCVFHADQGGVYCFDAATGQSRWSVKTQGGTFSVGHFLKKDKVSMVIQDGGVITCFDESGKQAWKYNTRLRGDDAYSHELLPGDADGDGLDEVFVNMQKLTLALRGDGNLMWEDKTQVHHSDFLSLADVDGDGRKECIYDHCGCAVGEGPLLIVDALTGKQKASIDYRAGGVKHAQKGVVGKFDLSRGGMQMAIGVKPVGMTLWDLATGELIWKRDVPATLLSRGDWDGDGNDEIMAFGMGVNVDGAFSVWNGKGERLYAISFLPSPSRTVKSKYGGSYSHAMPGGHEGVRRQVDLDGNGRADVIMPFGGWHWGSDSILFLMEGTKEGLQKSGMVQGSVVHCSTVVDSAQP